MFNVISSHYFLLSELQVQETKPFKLERNLKDVGVDPMLEAPGTPLDWSLQFKRQQKEIIELWQSCCVPLTHRTYFFLLFRGDPTDSIYMEVELRRLCFLKETFSNGNQSQKDRQTFTLASRFIFLSLLHLFEYLIYLESKWSFTNASNEYFYYFALSYAGLIHLAFHYLLCGGLVIYSCIWC